MRIQTRQKTFRSNIKAAIKRKRRKRYGRGWKRQTFAQGRKVELVALHPMGEGRVADTASLKLDAIWEGEWRENLLRAALERVKQTVNPAHYEMYHLQVVQGLTLSETARALGVSIAAVYLAKHRVGRLLKKELKRLEAPKP
jgi:DNA-directed RNA polymerase specialized sigma24 family protein